jgi:hypothetical protein
MAKATVVIPDPVPTVVTLELSLDEARWLMAVCRHINSTTRTSAHDLSIYNALDDGGLALSTSESEGILRSYETDYGVFLGLDD